MTQKQLQHLLQQPYKTENWKELLQHVFKNVQLLEQPQVIPIDDPRVNVFKQYGSVQLNDGKILALFELKLNDNVKLIRNRVGLNDIVSKYIDQESTHGVLSIFEQGTEDYRFTFTAHATEFSEVEGDFIDKKTDTKRFTYILGKNESCRTAAQRFEELSNNKDTANMDAVEKAFSVEKLSKQFFKEYNEQFNALVAYLKSQKGYFQAIFENDESAARNFVKVFMGRLVFIKFVEKKGWMGVAANEKGWENGDYQFLKNAFDSYNNKEIFVSQFLNPLFFEALNTGDRENDIFCLTGTKIPHLSGGLFENENPKSLRIDFSEELLIRLFDFFDRYNFTIDENDVHDKEVGIDPEMLGHIFENLLEDNKDKGAFYTPKEIVRYMCQESMKEYLKTYLDKQKLTPKDEKQAEELQETLSRFVEKKEVSKILHLDKALATALKEVKICDPAIGSGAFPMGLLNEIFILVKTLHDESPDRVGAVWGMPGETWQANTVKQNIIQNSIYGVDIEPGAVDIARLRFWLSLIIEEDIPQPLPHLDYKIVVGDTLVNKLDDTIINIDWDLKPENSQTNIFGNPHAEKTKHLLEEITKLQKAVFEPENDEPKLSEQIRNKKIDLLTSQINLMIDTKGLKDKPSGNSRNIKKQTELWLQTQGWKQQIKKLEQLKKQEGGELEFFDWKLDFPEIMNEELNSNPGFDIVIGNPPYVQLQKKGGELAKLFEKQGFQTFTKTGDIYTLFYEKGFNLLKQKGNLIFITSNKWMRAAYGKALREFFANQTDPLLLIDFAGQKVFETATVDTNILMFKKHKNLGETKACIIKDKWKKSLSSYVSIHQNLCKFYSAENWILLSPIEQRIKDKIEMVGIPLKDWDIKINRGILTGYNEAFIIDGKKKDELIAKDPKSAEIIRPILRGRDIKKYFYDFADLWLLYIPWHFPLHEDTTIKGASKKAEIAFQQQYPMVYEHLRQFKDKLSARNQAETGIRYEWYAMQRWGANYWEDFFRQKIIWKRIGSIIRFCYDEEECITLDSTCFATGGQIKYLVAILNSKMGNYMLKNSPKTGTGDLLISVQAITPIKIPVIDKKKRDELNFFLDIILNTSSTATEMTNAEKKINTIVFDLYQLNNEEIDFINIH